MSGYELPANDTKPRQFVSPKKIQRLIDAGKNPRDKAILATTFLSGCRISEVLGLDRSDIDVPIDVNGMQEVVVCGKNGKYRPVFFNAVIRKYLNSYLDARTDRFKPLFVSGQNKRITVSRVEQIVHQCARDAGLEEHVTPHILRHSFASDLLSNQASIYEVSKLLGHSNIATTVNIYGHFDTKMRKETLRTRQSRLV